MQQQDRAIARLALCRLLEGHPRFAVVGAAATQEEVLNAVAQNQPHVVLFDAAACDGDELQLLSALAEKSEGYQIVLLTASTDADAQRRAVSAGAMGLVQQSQSPEILFRAIECVAAGEIWIERTMAARALREKAHPTTLKSGDPQWHIATLTEREREVITLICQGMKNQAIAKSLFISEPTVRHRLTSIFEKLRVSDRLELVIFAYQHGLAELAR